MSTISENVLECVLNLILFSEWIITICIIIYLIGIILCKLCVKIEKSWICINFIERAITKRNIKTLKKSNLVLFILGEYLNDYKFDTRDELEREVKKYKYLIGDGISGAISMIISSRIFFFWSSKEEIKILKEVLNKNKEKLESVDFYKVKQVIRRIDYSNPYWEGKEEHTTIGKFYKYNDENYYKYFSKSPVEPKELLFEDFDFLKCRKLNEFIEVSDNPEKEFPLYIDPCGTIEQYYKNIK